MSSVGVLVLLAVFGEAPVAPVGPIAPRVDVDAAFVLGYGSRMAFGGVVEGTAGWKVWETPGGTGTLAVGLLGGYQNEPYGPAAAFVIPAVMSGSTHRFEVFAVAGHTFRLFPTRWMILGLKIFAGWTRVAMRGALSDPVQGISRSYQGDGSEFTIGSIVELGTKITERLSFLSRAILPLPYAGVAVSSYVMVSFGLSMSF